MPLTPVPLTQGAYTARSVIASAQRCCNLFGEENPKDSPFPLTFYPTPGLRLLATAPQNGWRCLYMASSRDLYGVCGNTVYWIDNTYTLHALGTIGTSTGIVSMADNNTTLLLVDGTANNGWTIDLASKAFSQVNPTDNSSSTGGYGFVGADRVASLDGYILLNAPGTNQFYSTDPNTIAFDPFWFGAKTGYSDNLMTIAVQRREIWLIGQWTTELWFDVGQTGTGIATFPFQIMPGPFMQHGTRAKYSVAEVGGSVFWLAQSQAGGLSVMQGERYETKRISTHAIESEWWSYPAVTDATGYTYTQQGHGFYCLNFPSADKTWCYDSATGHWHERNWLDTNGVAHRHRAQVHAWAYGLNIVGDWQNGNLYALDPLVYTDNGQPIERVRSWPHLVMNSKRVAYRQFIADMQVGSEPQTTDYTPARRVQTDATLVCRGIPPDPLKLALVDGAVPLNTSALPPPDAEDMPVTADATLWGDGTDDAPLTVNAVDGAVAPVGGAVGAPPWVAHDDTLSGDGSAGKPLHVDLVDGVRGIPPCNDATLRTAPVVWLRWSDTRGASWGNPVQQSLGGTGEFLTSVQWQRLGLARDRVFEIQWSAPVRTALSGAWVDAKEGTS